MKYFDFLFLLPLLFLLSCGDEDKPQEPPDPCEDVVPFTASFTIYEQLWVWDSLFSTQGAITYNNTYFAADDKYWSYKWKIGDDQRVFTDSCIVFRFKQPWSNLKVTLIATGPPNRECFPDDDGIDTVTKSFSVVENYDSPMIGDYFGYNIEFPNDTFTVNIGYIKMINQHNWIEFYINNINKDCFDIPDSTAFEGRAFIDVYLGYSNLKFCGKSYVGNCCLGPCGYAKLENSLIYIEIDYSIYDTSKDFSEFARKKLKFVGRRN